MNFTSKYYVVFLTMVVFLLTSCSVGNKFIPDPGGNIGVDTTNTTLNTFKVYVTGDTSFVMTVTSIDSLNTLEDDSLTISAFEFAGTALTGAVGFRTYASIPDTYVTEGSPPGITTADFGILKTLRGARKIYTMNHGTVTITSHDEAAKTVKGRFDVNNQYALGADRYLKATGYFYIKYE